MAGPALHSNPIATAQTAHLFLIASSLFLKSELDYVSANRLAPRFVVAKNFQVIDVRVVCAQMLHDSVFRRKFEMDRPRVPWLGIHAGVVNRDVQIHASEIEP